MGTLLSDSTIMDGLDILLCINSFDISPESILVFIEFATVMKINAHLF